MKSKKSSMFTNEDKEKMDWESSNINPWEIRNSQIFHYHNLKSSYYCTLDRKTESSNIWRCIECGKYAPEHINIIAELTGILEIETKRKENFKRILKQYELAFKVPHANRS